MTHSRIEARCFLTRKFEHQKYSTAAGWYFYDGFMTKQLNAIVELHNLRPSFEVLLAVAANVTSMLTTYPLLL